MVRGLELFRAHFDQFRDRYALIGGTACDLAMNEVGLGFRATKDLDIVLWVEALDEPFVLAFWDFINKGGYQTQQTSTGKPQFYRFQHPQDASYPSMLGADAEEELLFGPLAAVPQLSKSLLTAVGRDVVGWHGLPPPQRADGAARASGDCATGCPV